MEINEKDADFTLKTDEDKTVSLSDFAGKATLIVNVASKCGLTPQYEALEQLHERYKDRLCNLIPLSSQMNQSLKNAGYEKKRKRYSEDSMFKSARQLAQKYKSWTPGEMTTRSNELAAWAVGRWRS